MKVGEDKRFDLSSYRGEAAVFLLRPVMKEAVWRSLARYMESLYKNPVEPELRGAGRICLLRTEPGSRDDVQSADTGRNINGNIGGSAGRKSRGESRN